MTLDLLTKPMTLRHKEPGTVDESGRPTPAITETDVLGGYRHRLFGTVEDGGMVAIEELVVYLPPDCGASASDEVLIDGQVYELQGKPHRAWNHRLGFVHHLECRARGVER